MQARINHLLLRGFDGDPAAKGGHLLDAAIASITHRDKMFSDGWGDESILSSPSQRPAIGQEIPPVTICWEKSEGGLNSKRNGLFLSPLKLLPSQVSAVHLRTWQRPGNRNACVILAGSRDEGYHTRERVFGSLASRGIDLYFLENPFYGRRRAASGPSLRIVSDHTLMAAGMVFEARALLKSLSSEYKNLIVAGYSMGGHMAAITAAVCPFPIACAALATGASAAAIYTRGLLSWSVDFRALSGNMSGFPNARQKLQSVFAAADITQYSPPLRPDAAVIVGCRRDGYVLKEETERLHNYWLGSKLRWINAGHFSALFTCKRDLCDAVLEAGQRLNIEQVVRC